MARGGKARIVWEFSLNALLTLMFILTAFVGVSVIRSRVQTEVPSIFGYSAMTVLSDSMTASGYNRGDVIVSREVDSDSLKIGDKIVFYVHSETSKPVQKGESRHDVVVFFHEIVDERMENSVRYFRTKGSSNAEADPFWVNPDAVAGQLVEVPQVVRVVLRFLVGREAIIYLTILCGVILFIKEMAAFASAFADYRVARKVVRGELMLLDRICFKQDIFKSFSGKQREIVMARAPLGQEMIYEYLLYGRVTERSAPQNIVERLVGKHYKFEDVVMISDSSAALAFNMRNVAEEPFLEIHATSQPKDEGFVQAEFIDNLPNEDKRFTGYRNSQEFKESARKERVMLYAVLVGSLLFAAVYLTLGLVVGFLKTISPWLTAAVFAIPPVVALWAALSARFDRKKYREFVIWEGGRDSVVEYATRELPISQTPLLLTAGISAEEYAAEAAAENSGETDEDDIVGFDYPTDNLIAMDYCLDTKLRLTTEECKRKFSDLKNEILSYRGVKDRLSSQFNTFKRGWQPLAKIGVRKDIVKLYLHIDPIKLDKKYHVRNMSEINQFRDYPSLIKVRSARSFQYAIELIGQMMSEWGYVKNPKYVPKDFTADYPFVKNGFMDTEGVYDKECKSSSRTWEEFVGSFTELKKSNEKHAFILLKTDELETINRYYGWGEAEKLLGRLGHILDANLIDREIYSQRFGGEVIALMKMTDQESLTARLKKIVTEWRSAEYLSLSLAFGVSIGICDQDNIPIDRCYDRARDALGLARRRGGDKIGFWTDIWKSSEEQIAKDFSAALKRNEIQIYLQPKYYLSDGRVRGAEALSRWFHSDLGLLPPNIYIPTLEKHGLISELDYYVFEQICKKMKKWQERGGQKIEVSFNVSKIMMDERGFASKLAKIADKYGVSPSLLEVEITETILATDYAKIVTVLESLKKFGFKIAMDDFGSKYSSLNMLGELVNIDEIKLDCAFISRSESVVRDRAIIRNIIKMARDINIGVVAEGVETREQADFLSECGCDVLQGYFYGRPMAESDFARLFLSEE